MTPKLAVQKFLECHNYIKVVPRAALIDMDGTLYDSMPSHARAWQQMMAELGVDVPREQFFMYEGRTGASQIKLLFEKYFGVEPTEQQCADLYRRKTELFAEMPPVEVMPGAAEMLTFLKEIGVKCVLVTGSGQRTLIDRLQRDFPGIFTPDTIVSSRDVRHGKPHAEPYLKGLEVAGFRADEAIVIENAPLGVEAGHRAGIFTIGVNTGPIDPAALADAGADLVYDSMTDFAEMLPLVVYSLLTTMNNFN